jgi:hypothetical protein
MNQKDNVLQRAAMELERVKPILQAKTKEVGFWNAYFEFFIVLLPNCSIPVSGKKRTDNKFGRYFESLGKTIGRYKDMLTK